MSSLSSHPSDTTAPFSWSLESAGLSVHRFTLQRETDYYWYDEHMIALPLGGRGSIEWECDGARGAGPIQLDRVTVEPARSFVHRCRWYGMTGISLYFQPQVLAEVAHEEIDPDRVELRAAVNRHDPTLAFLLRVMFSEAARGPHGFALQVETLGVQVAALLLQRYATRPHRLRESSARLSTAQVEGVRAHLAAHPGRNVSLAALAAAAGGMSVFHFTRLFRRTFGRTPHQFVLRQRVLQAEELLRQGDLNLAEVALATGFCDQSHLTRCFQRFLGETPGRRRLPQRARLSNPAR